VSLDKADLSDYKIDQSSPMPSFDGKLQGAQFDDLVAWLASRRGAKGELK
jgi:hypothetical protein